MLCNSMKIRLKIATSHFCKRLRDSLLLITFSKNLLFLLMKRITIKDLAKILNLSTSTVSRALSDHSDISSSTKKRVKTVASQLNYTTNVHARFFRNQHSNLIALVLPEINMFFTPSLIKGINKAIAPTNYSLITFLTNDKHKREKEIIKQCLNWAVEGVLISLSNETYNLEHLTPLTQAKIQCVIFDKSLKNENYPSVVIDSIGASYQAVSHLIMKGHQNILGIFGNPGLRISKERLEGYEKALRENNIPIKSENIIFVDKDKNLDFILPPILNHNKNLTAIFTMSDELLSKSLYHLGKLNFNIPKDISIISISDGVYPYLVHPQVTHIKDSGSKMGKIAAKVLIEGINGKIEDANLRTISSTKLVDLESIQNISV